MKTFRIAALALGTILALQANAATGRYDLKDVGAGVPVALNASAQIVVSGGGAATYVVTGPQGVGGVNPCPASAAYCRVVGIDDAGDVGLQYGATLSPSMTSALAHFDGTNLRKLVDPAGPPQLEGLSHDGKMTGNDQKTVFRGSAPNKHVHDLALPANVGAALATAINDRRQIVGRMDEAGSHMMLALPDGSPMQDLGGLPAGNSEFCTASAISNNGYIVGYANVTTNDAVHAPLGIYYHAVLARVGVSGLTDLGTLDGNGYGFSSFASAVNNAGTVVGVSEKDDIVDTAFVLNVGDMVMTDLNTLVDLPAGLRLVNATGINEAGQVIAEGSDGHAWLLTPR